MALPDLTGQNIEETYPRLLHTDSGLIYDGTGSLVDVISATASFAVSASYAISASHEIVKEVSSSYAETASLVIGEGSGSFSGSFQGDGSNLTDVTASFVPVGLGGIYEGSGTVPSSTVATLTDNFTFTGGDVNVNGNTFITGSLTVSGSNSTINTQELQFDTDHIKSGHSTGRMFWDDDNKTVTLDMQGSDVRLQIGQEEHVYAKNTSGVTINNGDAVRISGAVGANVTIEKAISSIKSFKDTTEQDQILGVATEQIPDNQSGYVTTFGAVRDLDTSAFNEGDILYLSNTTSGSYSSLRPPAPFFEARVGVVQVSNPTEGVVLVRPAEPIFLTDISQVTGSGVVVGGTSYLCYNDNTEIIEFTNSFTGSFSGSFVGFLSGSADLPDLTNSTGITAFTYDGSTTAIIQVSGSDTLSTNTLPKWTGDALTDTNITDNGSVVAINSLTNITGSVDVLNGNVNLDANSYFFQGTSTGGSNVSLIGVNNQDQIYIGNQGFDNIIADDLAIQGNATISGSLIVSGSTTNNIQLFLPLTSSNDISSSADIYGRTGSFDYLGISGNVDIIGDLTVNDIFSQNITSTGSFNHTGSISQIGNTIQIGNYTLTGSFNHSGSHDQVGDFTQTGNVTQEGDYTLTGSFNHSGSTTHIGNFSITGSTTLNGAVSFKTYRLTSSAYTASVDDYRIGVKYTLTGSVEIQLPLIATAGEIEYKFKDEEGNAKKNNITIIASGSDLIDGDVNAILNRNYIAIGIYNDGTSNWFIE